MTKQQKGRVKDWVKRLRSGEFKQAREILRDSHQVVGRIPRPDDYSYCCLGVACRVYLDAQDDEQWDPEWDNYRLPAEVRDWFGFHNNNPYLGDETASTYNDSEEESFEQIADRIEATYLKEGK